MEHGPLPPHERTWRHPSELAAQERELARAEPVPSASRAFAITTGTMGLVAIAVLFLLVTPSRHDQPVAVSATTSPAASPTEARFDVAASIAAARRTLPDGVVVAQSAAETMALATPIGTGKFALVLRTALPSEEPTDLDVVLPSGRHTLGRIVGAIESSDTVLIRLDEAEPGPDVAGRRPHDRDVVTVMAQPPIEVTLSELDQVDVADGTAVVDAEGHLVGLCSERADGDGVRLVEIPASITDATDG